MNKRAMNKTKAFFFVLLCAAAALAFFHALSDAGEKYGMER